MFKRTLTARRAGIYWTAPVLLLLAVLLAACAAPVAPAATVTEMAPTITNTPSAAPSADTAPATPAANSTAPAAPSSQPAAGTPFDASAVTLPITCELETVVQPTLPAKIPAYLEVDPATGLHMTGGVEIVDLQGYALEVTGKVDRPLKLTYDELRCLPKVETNSELVCPGFFTDIARWSGASLAAVLDLAGVQEDAKYINFRSVDGYFTYVSPQIARSPENLLAYELEGETLSILHGFPVRAVLPGQDGNKWAKWLVQIEVE